LVVHFFPNSSSSFLPTFSSAGKSTLCRILLSYAVRAGSKPLFVDLDVSGSAISVPGTLSATSIEHPISVEMSADMGGGGGSAHTLSIKSPLAYFYGHTSPLVAPELYTRLMSRLASVVERRCAEHPLANSSGLIINTGATVDSTPGTPTYELVIQTAHTFSVDVIFVLDRDDLTQALKNDKRLQAASTTVNAASSSSSAAAAAAAAGPAGVPATPASASSGALSSRVGVSVAQLSKSGGVASRDASARKKAQSRALREYFYGSPGLEFVPHQKVVGWKEIEIYRVGGGPVMPSSVMPLGSAAKKNLAADPTRLTRLTPSLDLQHSILALSYAKESGAVLDSNVAGFVHVAAVDVIKKTVTLLTPAPGPLPNNIFIAGQIKWID
jgi:polyribonucleotide 5'-hydroxyl-kinase